MRSITNSITQWFKQFFLINDTPHNIAAGAALGVFLGIAPGAGVTATIVLASIFRLNRLAAIAGAVATNTWTLIFILPLAAAVGGTLCGQNTACLISQYEHLQTLGFSFLFSKEIFLTLVLPLAIGFIVVSGVIAFLFYLLTLSLLKMRKHLPLTEEAPAAPPTSSPCDPA